MRQLHRRESQSTTGAKQVSALHHGCTGAKRVWAQRVPYMHVGKSSRRATLQQIGPVGRRRPRTSSPSYVSSAPSRPTSSMSPCCGACRRQRSSLPWSCSRRCPLKSGSGPLRPMAWLARVQQSSLTTRVVSSGCSPQHHVHRVCRLSGECLPRVIANLLRMKVNVEKYRVTA